MFRPSGSCLHWQKEWRKERPSAKSTQTASSVSVSLKVFATSPPKSHIPSPFSCIFDPLFRIGLEKQITVLQLIAYVKKHTKMSESMSLFIEVGATVPGMNTVIGELYERFVSDDGFLYITVKTEDSF